MTGVAMIAQEITDQLRSIASADYFEERSAKLTDAWSAAGVGTEVLEPVLQFMQEYPEIDFGAPGSTTAYCGPRPMRDPKKFIPTLCDVRQP
jgi:hypothetical protein